MELLHLFLTEYGTTILYAVLTALAGYLGVVAKRLYEKVVNDRVKEAVARTCVKAVEQIYKDLHGEEKLQKALVGASEMLTEKGIRVSELELRLLLESALSEYNHAFEKTENATALGTPEQSPAAGDTP